MLIGSANHSIDAKGRYIVPAKFRADLGDRFVVTQGVGGCLFAFSLEQWDLVSRRLAELPASDKNTLNFKRRFFSRAFELELDSQSRCRRIPTSLCRCAVNRLPDAPDGPLPPLRFPDSQSRP